MGVAVGSGVGVGVGAAIQARVGWPQASQVGVGAKLPIDTRLSFVYYTG